MQSGRPVAFASRSLSEIERWYAKIEKEMLAVVYGLENFHYYSRGRKVNFVINHNPLVAIRAKFLSKAPKRLQNLFMREQNYIVTIEYKPKRESRCTIMNPHKKARKSRCIQTTSSGNPYRINN